MELSWSQRLKNQGQAEGLAWAILALLQKRGIPLTERRRSEISACRDVLQLQTWLLRSSEVSDMEELFPVGWATPERDRDELLSERASELEDSLDEAYTQLASLFEQRTNQPESQPLQQAITDCFSRIEALKTELLEVIQTARESRARLPENAGREMADYAKQLLRGEDATPPSYLTTQHTNAKKA